MTYRLSETEHKPQAELSAGGVNNVDMHLYISMQEHFITEMGL